VEVLCKASLAALTVCPLGYRPLAECLSKLHFPSWLTRVIAFTLVFREDPMLADRSQSEIDEACEEGWEGLPTDVKCEPFNDKSGRYGMCRKTVTVQK
jgi:hypothetical protein